MNVSSLAASVFSLCAFSFIVAERKTSPLCCLVDFVLILIIQYRIGRVKVWQRPFLGEECHTRCKLTCNACDILLLSYQEGDAYSSVVSFSSFERWRAAARKASAMAVVSPISPPGRLLRSGFSLARSRLSFFPS